MGTQPPNLLLLSFIIQGLSRDRPDGPLKQTLVWERVTQGRRDLQGQDHPMLASPVCCLGQACIFWVRDPLTFCWNWFHGWTDGRERCTVMG